MDYPEITYPNLVMGRVDTGLDAVELHVVHSKGTLRMDANTALVYAATGTLPLGGPIGPSCLSGQPGFLFRTCEVQLLLTEEELYRILRRDLWPDEVLSLRRRFGSFFEVNDEFYYQTAGVAKHPFPLATG